MRGMNRKALLLLAFALAAHAAAAGPLRGRMSARRPLAENNDLDDERGSMHVTLPAGVTVVRDVAYGNDPAQRLDVYLSGKPHNAPVIVMVHGGGWRRGDKGLQTVVENKVARWVPHGFLFISVNYRLLPAANPLEQSKDVAKAIAFAQQRAAEWGGDRDRFILMGHSAGAHLVALLAAAGTVKALGAVILDSAALDVPQTMTSRHLRLYDEAFGRDRALWRAASPYHNLAKSGPPMLAVCSSRRADSCPAAHQFIDLATSNGRKGSVLEKDFSHKEINELLGADPAYTAAVESFLRGLDGTVAQFLGGAGR